MKRFRIDLEQDTGAEDGTDAPGAELCITDLSAVMYVMPGLESYDEEALQGNGLYFWQNSVPTRTNPREW